MRRVLFLVVAALAATHAANFRGRSANLGRKEVVDEIVTTDDGDYEEDHHAFSKVVSVAQKDKGGEGDANDDVDESSAQMATKSTKAAL